MLDVHVNKEIYQPKQQRYLGSLKRYDLKKNKDYVQYFKEWNAQKIEDLILLLKTEKKELRNYQNK